jgi:hypothetical protein
MIKQEFEQLAMRGNGEISGLLYQVIERFYMSTNNYHEAHGGIDETKQEFVKRVFGVKINTPRTILTKITNEAIKENRWCLQGIGTATKNRLDEMDAAITEYYQFCSKHNE